MCYSECSTCIEPLICETCISAHASPSTTLGCQCNAGYYGVPPLVSLNSCIQCFGECATCNQTLICLSCISKNAWPSTAKGCTCDEGFYQIGPLVTADSCGKCHSECATCNQTRVCVECMAANASPSPSQGCTCNSGYYGNKPLADSTSCSLCSDYNPKCAVCNRLNPDICLECIPIYYLQGSVCIECESTEYFNATTETCDQCTVLCQSCTSLNNCTECSAHSSLNSEGYCECITGYSGTDSCIKDVLIALLTVNSDNILTLHFSDDLSIALQASDFNLSINNIPQTYQVAFIDQGNYRITIDFQDGPNEGDKVFIVFLRELISVDNACLSTKNVSAKLFAVFSQYSQAELNQVQTYSTIGMAIGVSLSLGGSFLGMDLSTFFNFVNAAEIFTYAVVYDLDLDTQIVVFLNGLRIVPQIPSIFDAFLKAEDGIEMNAYYSDFGFSTSLFMLNQGILISVIMFLILTIPLFYIIGYVKNENLQIYVRKLKRFRHSFFFRLWIQSCIEVTMSAVIGILYNNQANLTQIIDYIICYISIVINI